MCRAIKNQNNGPRPIITYNIISLQDYAVLVTPQPLRSSTMSRNSVRQLPSLWDEIILKVYLWLVLAWQIPKQHFENDENIFIGFSCFYIYLFVISMYQFINFEISRFQALELYTVSIFRSLYIVVKEVSDVGEGRGHLKWRRQVSGICHRVTSDLIGSLTASSLLIGCVGGTIVDDTDTPGNHLWSTCLGCTTLL